MEHAAIVALAADLDIEEPEALLAYLRGRGAVGRNEEPMLEVLTGGVSNRVVRVSRRSGESWVLKQALARLRVEVEWVSDPSRAHREAMALTWLPRLAPPASIPKLLFEDQQHHLLAMEAVPDPHVNWKTKLLAGHLDTADVEAFARMLAGIHRSSHVRHQELAPIFGDTAIFESLRIEPYFLFTAKRVTEAARYLNDLVAQLRGHRLALVHGDYSPKNVLIHAGRLVLLDHEVIHFGDPAFDLGFSMAHLLSKAHHLPNARASFAEAALTYWSLYSDGIGDVHWVSTLEGRAVRCTLGCLLARVAGRSPLEYLDAGERDRQRAVVLALMIKGVDRFSVAVPAFVELLSRV